MAYSIDTPISFACGHTAERKLHGSRRDRQAQVWRLAGEICPPCEFLRDRMGLEWTGTGNQYVKVEPGGSVSDGHVRLRRRYVQPRYTIA